MKSFVIVIEGTDKCGKTSLAVALSEILGWPIVKCSQPGPAGAVHEYLTALADNPGPFIADRFHLGESVYGPIYRGTAPMNALDYREIESELADRGALLVLMEDSPDRIAERFKRLGESFAQVADIERILHEFDREWGRSRLAKIRATWDAGLPEDIGGIVRRMAAALEVRR